MPGTVLTSVPGTVLTSVNVLGIVISVKSLFLNTPLPTVISPSGKFTVVKFCPWNTILPKVSNVIGNVTVSIVPSIRLANAPPCISVTP